MSKKRSFSLGILMLVLAFLLSGCKEKYIDTVFYDASPYSEYYKVVSKMLPSFSLIPIEGGVINTFREGCVTEAFDTQALSALKDGLIDYWYPQYLATAVIAVNRDKTDVEIKGWSDLARINEDVAISNTNPYANHLYVSAAYGLEKESFSLDGMAKVFRQIHEKRNLRYEDYEAPIIICFDYQAVSMIKAGHNMEIIIPIEGTLSFEKGLVSKEAINNTYDSNALVDAGFRTIDGISDDRYFPSNQEYERATILEDYDHLNKSFQSMSKTIRREILNVKQYAAADGQEHQMVALIYIVLLIIWTVSILHRTMQNSVRKAVLAFSALLVTWVLLRVLKYQLYFVSTASRYAWYGYYIFQIAIPLVILWLAWRIDKPDDEIVVPKWFAVFTIVSSILLGLVMTNDLHQLTFIMDLSSTTWNDNYTYGIVYYAIVLCILIEAILAQIIMVRKSWENPRRTRFLAPLGFYMILVAYSLAYIFRLPFAWGSDITVVTGVFVLAFIESCIRSGFVPVNKKYRGFFVNSPHKMQIIDDKGNVVLASTGASTVDESTWRRIIESPGKPNVYDDDTLLYVDEISGGIVMWQEDISSINRLNEEIKMSIERLEAANSILFGEEEVQRKLTVSKERLALFTGLEKEICQQSAKLSDLLHAIPKEEEERRPYLVRAAMLVCYIKRRCNLFFLERESVSITDDELAVYMDELIEFANISGVKCLCTCKFKGALSSRRATLMYDFFYEIISWMLENGGNMMFMQIVMEKDNIIMKLMPSVEISEFETPINLKKEIAAECGEIILKELVELTGIWLTFPKGGS